MARPNGETVRSRCYRFKRACMFTASNGTQTVGPLQARFILPEMSELSKEFIFAILLVFVTEDYTCPFCSLECASYKGLECHLPASHDLFNYEFLGTYLASVTRSGCITVHKYESLNSESDQGKDEKKQLRHFSLFDGISTVRWNPSNQDEIAYTSMRTGELTIFDVEYSQATKVSSKRPHVTQGSSDVAFLNDGMRVLASDTSGAISMWDRRASDLPQRFLTTKKNIGLTGIQLLGDQDVYGASKTGIIYIWDLRRLRGGGSLAGIQSDEKVHSSPLTSVNLEPTVKEIGPLKIYAAASTSSNGLHLLDFYPHPSSPCHVDYDESKSPGRPLSISKAYLYRYLSMLLLVPFIHLMAPLSLEP